MRVDEAEKIRGKLNRGTGQRTCYNGGKLHSQKSQDTETKLAAEGKYKHTGSGAIFKKQLGKQRPGRL